MYYVEVDSSNSRRYGTATCGSLCFDLFCDVISSTTLNVFIYNAAQKKVSTNNKDYIKTFIWHSFPKYLTLESLFPRCSDDFKEKKLPGMSKE